MSQFFPAAILRACQLLAVVEVVLLRTAQFICVVFTVRGEVTSLPWCEAALAVTTWQLVVFARGWTWCGCGCWTCWAFFRAIKELKVIHCNPAISQLSSVSHHHDLMEDVNLGLHLCHTYCEGTKAVRDQDLALRPGLRGSILVSPYHLLSRKIV